ncbi:MAG: polyamine aminopropyltransferase, partial [Candidatus Omnitrophota bacterium]
GGTLREVSKHPVKEIVMVDLDRGVVDISKQYLPFVSEGSFSDKRLQLNFADGIKFIEQYSDYFDVIIVDCTDPIGPGKVLFGMDFYKKLFAALKKDGIAMFQLGPFLDFDLFVEDSAQKLKKLFASIHPVRLCMPSYSCGSEYCFMAASKQVDLKKIKTSVIDRRLKVRLGGKAKKLKYYTPEVHSASLVMPRLWQL